MATEVEAMPPRKVKKQPLSAEDFDALINEVVIEHGNVYHPFTGAAKKGITFPEGAPGKNEFSQWDKQLLHLGAIYKKLLKMDKKKAKKKAAKAGAPPADSNEKGFKQPRYVCAAAVTFVNTHGNVPPDLKLIPLPECGGDAVWNIAQGTQLFSSYVDEKKLKGVEKSKITLDQPMTDLFKPYFGQIDKVKIVETDGKYILTHTTLQALIPRLFDRELPVLPEQFPEDEKMRSRKRAEVFKERTGVNRAARDAVDKTARAEKAAATAAAKQAAKDAKEAAK